MMHMLTVSETKLCAEIGSARSYVLPCDFSETPGSIPVNDVSTLLFLLKNDVEMMLTKN
jgi:hypothetical protein